MDAIKDLMPSRKFEEPEEVQVIKNFVQEKYGFTPKVTMQQAQIIIAVRGSALAGTLRMHLHEIKELCQTDKRLVVRIA